MKIRSIRPRSLWRAGLALLLLTTAAVQAAPNKAGDWTITNLGAGFARASIANTVNNRGDVGGYAQVVVPGSPWPVLSHAILWQDGQARDLGAELGSRPGQASSNLQGINDGGTAAVSGPDGLMLYKNGQWATLGVPAAFAYDISNNGTIVGTYNVGSGSRPFMYRNGAFIDLGTLGGTLATAQAVNERGLAVGMAWRADFFNRGFFWQDGVLREIGTFGGLRGGAFDVNNRGDIVGFAQDAAGRSIAMITDTSGVPRPVGDFPGNSTAWAINEKGNIVVSTDFGAYLVSDGTQMRLEDLPAVKAANWSQLFPLDINDRGWIVGWGWRRGGSFQSEAFLLTPK